MKKRNLDNETLDMIGRKLIEREGVPSVGMVDEIVANPQLFERVSKRIAVNEKPSGGTFQFLFSRNAMAFSGIALVLVAAIAALSLLRSENTTITASEAQVPEAVPEVRRPVIPPQGTVLQKPAGRPSAVKASNRQAAPVPRAVKRRPRDLSQSDFYAVAYTGDPAETAGGGRIIRVNLDRSSLFALGVNLALENDVETFQADLLVGSDGVTRGVRVVK